LGFLDKLRVCALLHDIGKVECWANEKSWARHIDYTYKFVKECLGEDLASSAMRHHTGRSYSSEVFPRTEFEKIISLADNLASGADRPEKSDPMGSKPSFPLDFTHVLSNGEVPVKCWDAASLAMVSKILAGSLRKPCSWFSSDSLKAYLEIFRELENSDLKYVPADTRKPVNDVSLWDHMKLTAAFSTCIFLDGGYRGDNLDSYSFALVSGDADRITHFINVSSRLPDLNARSEKIKNATQKAREAVAQLLGPECVVFAGGGGLFAISPVAMADKVCEAIKKGFEAETTGLVTVTVSQVRAKGVKVQKDFGSLWKEAQQQMRLRKSERLVTGVQEVPDGSEVCDVCRSRPASYEDAGKILPYDASPRPEKLCESCWQLRLEGRGESLDHLKDQTNLVALIRADGDGVGKVLGGERFDRFKKTATPSRLTTISRYLQDVCEKGISRIAEEAGGRCLIAGGDDALVIVPGKEALNTARRMSAFFRKSMAGECTMSAGVVIFRYDLPIYAALEAVDILLRLAKKVPEKNSVAFAFIGGVCLTPDEVGRVKHGPREWSQLDEVLELARMMGESGVASTQVRIIAVAAKENPVYAEVLVKNLMGKSEKGKGLNWVQGERLLRHLESGILLDAFAVYNAFKV